MRINIINGSPKMGESTSGLLITYLLAELKGHNVETFNINKTLLTQNEFCIIRSSDVLVLVFPLYIDSIPAHFLQQLITLEKEIHGREIRVYCIINNGFYEGKQNHIAIEQIKIWCQSAGLLWGQAIGIGTGEMLPFIKDIPLGHGPNKNIGNAIKDLADNIKNGNRSKDILISSNYPRFLWKIQSSLMFWLPRAKKNGLSKHDLFKEIK